MKEYESIGRYISYLYRMGQCYINRRLEPFCIGSGQFAFLMVLYMEDGISQDELSERILVDKATTGRAIKKLVEEGYVVRHRDPKDKRSYQIYLTPKANSLKSTIFEILKEWNELLLNGIDEPERDCGLGMIKKMVANVTTSKKSST